jgi:hypothetical protein
MLQYLLVYPAILCDRQYNAYARVSQLIGLHSGHCSVLVLDGLSAGIIPEMSEAMQLDADFKTALV